jgi:hypothetical protein
MSDIKLDRRKVAVAARLARFAAKMGSRATSCPYSDDDPELRRVWLSAYLREMPPKSGSVKYSDTVAAAARELTAEEQASGVDFEAIAAEHDENVAEVTGAWPAIGTAMIASIAATAAALFAAGGIAGLLDLGPSAGSVAKLSAKLTSAGVAAAKRSTARVGRELDAIGLPAKVSPPTRADIEARAKVAAGLIASGMSNAATKSALAVGKDATRQQVSAAVRSELDRLVTDENNWVTGSIDAAMASIEGTARMGAYEAMAELYRGQVAWIASEVNDKNRCGACRKIDGRRFDTFAEARAAYPTGQYAHCAGGARCRGMVFAIKS